MSTRRGLLLLNPGAISPVQPAPASGAPTFLFFGPHPEAWELCLYSLSVRGSWSGDNAATSFCTRPRKAFLYLLLGGLRRPLVGRA